MKAFIFPGQGGQFVGQGRAWAEADPAVMKLFEAADAVSGRPVSRLCFEGPAAELGATENLQPAVLTVSLAALRMMRAKYGAPDFVAGHSLGEFGALVAAGVLGEEAALDLVSRRAAIMSRCTEKNPGSMCAVIGMEPEELESICELARAEGQLVRANFNTPEQTVISGESRAVAAAVKYIKLKHGKALPLPVSGAFHSPLMKEAAAEFAAILEKTAFAEPACPLVPNTLGVPVKSADEIKKALMGQIDSPVLWTKTVESLKAAGVNAYIEAWPKSYLGGMVKKCLPKEEAGSVSFVE